MRARRALHPLRRPTEQVVRKAAAVLGYDLLWRDYYSPIPVIDDLRADFWDSPSDTPGVDLHIADAVDLLRGPLQPYLAEFRPPLEPGASNGTFYLNNIGYGAVDADILYAMVRHLRPRRIHELGSGYSSHVIHLAAEANTHDGAPLQHTIFDPFPFHDGGLAPVAGAEVHAVRVEAADARVFDTLDAGDILFVDTTHTVRTGGDVTHIVLSILPRLRAGVMVHVHDVFLPFEYPREWVVEVHRAWAEQYLLQAFLAFNTDFSVVLPNYAVTRSAPELVRQLAPSLETGRTFAGGFWIRRDRVS
jgi:hypothetical protein